jgi:Rrf2 family protein
MNQNIPINEADSIALHGMALLSNRGRRYTSGKAMAETLEVSFEYLHRVFNRLEKQGLVQSVTGPWGGYRLARPGGEITLLEIYEAMEGKLKPRDCLMENRVCRGRKCVLGDLLVRMNREFRQYLAGARLSEFKHQYPEGNGGKHEKKNRKD